MKKEFSVMLKICCRVDVEPWEEAEAPFHTEYVAKIIADHGEGLEPDEKVIGHIEATRIDLAQAINSHMTMFEVFDRAFSEEVFDLAKAVYDYRKLEFRPSTCRALSGDVDEINTMDDLLMITEIIVRPEYSGMNIGLLSLGQFINTVAYSSVTVLTPYPLTRSSVLWDDDSFREMYGVFDTKGRAAVRKIKNHYSKLGFKALSRKDVMVLCPYYMTDLRELGYPPNGIFTQKEIQ